MVGTERQNSGVRILTSSLQIPDIHPQGWPRWPRGPGPTSGSGDPMAKTPPEDLRSPGSSRLLCPHPQLCLFIDGIASKHLHSVRQDLRNAICSVLVSNP